MSTAILEDLILSKSYFDREGLLIAEDRGTIVGCCHAWPLPDEVASVNAWLTSSGKAGTTGLLVVAAVEGQESIATSLLHLAETYLQRQHCVQLFGGNATPFDQFYLGIYGGATPAGILASDEVAVRAFEQRGYAEERRSHLWGRSMDDFRPPIDRVQRMLKNDYEVRIEEGLVPDAQWQPQAWSHVEWNRASLYHKRTEAVAASLAFWDVQPMSKDWQEATFGLVMLQDDATARSSGLTLFLLGETLQMVQREHGIERAELIAIDQDISLQDVYRKLGFEAYDSGILFRKAAPQ